MARADGPPPSGLSPAAVRHTRPQSHRPPAAPGSAARGAAARLALLLGALAVGSAPACAEDLAPARLLAPVTAAPFAAAPLPRLAPLRALEGPARAPVAGEGVEIVHFFATWCAPCKRELPALGRFAARHPAVPVVLVDVAEPEDRVRRFFETAPPPGPVLLDPDRAVARAFDISLLPATLGVSGGRIRLVLEGEVAWDDPANDALIAALAAPGAAPPPATR